MEAEKKTISMAESVTGISQERFDPEELWLNIDIEPEELIRLDPLDITRRMVEHAEQPELANPVLRRLPE